MQLVSYLRDRAIHLRLIADDQVDTEQRVELLDLADVCDEVADSIEDGSTCG